MFDMHRARIIAAILFLAGAGLALAEEAAPDFVPRWERAPPATDGIIIPSAPVDGVVVLCCRPRRSRSLECNVGYEQPRNYSYGYFAINRTAYYVLTPESAAEFNARPYRPIQLTHYFRVSGAEGSLPAPNYRCPIPHVIVTP